MILDDFLLKSSFCKVQPALVTKKYASEGQSSLFGDEKLKRSNGINLLVTIDGFSHLGFICQTFG